MVKTRVSGKTSEAEARRFVDAVNKAAGMDVGVVGDGIAIVNISDMFDAIFEQVATLVDTDLVVRRKLSDFLKAQGYNTADIVVYGGTINMAARLVPSRYPDVNALAEAIRNS